MNRQWFTHIPVFGDDSSDSMDIEGACTSCRRNPRQAPYTLCGPCRLAFAKTGLTPPGKMRTKKGAKLPRDLCTDCGAKPKREKGTLCGDCAYKTNTTPCSVCAITGVRIQNGFCNPHYQQDYKLRQKAEGKSKGKRKRVTNDDDE